MDLMSNRPEKHTSYFFQDLKYNNYSDPTWYSNGDQGSEVFYAQEISTMLSSLLFSARAILH